MQRNETEPVAIRPVCMGFRHVQIPIPDPQNSTNIKEGHAAISF